MLLNIKTAKTLGIKIPDNVLSLADDVGKNGFVDLFQISAHPPCSHRVRVID
jgi:hypothetical protein